MLPAQKHRKRVFSCLSRELVGTCLPICPQKDPKALGVGIFKFLDKWFSPPFTLLWASLTFPLVLPLLNDG